MIHDTLSTASVALMNFVLAALGCDEPTPIFGNSGLPGAVECLDHDVIIAMTPITEPMFDQALLRCAATRRRDTLLIRHGFHPETIDPVRVDVALRSLTGPLLLTDLAFFRDRDRDLHLVPERGGLSVKIGHDGIEVATRLPWDSMWDRAAGLENAAAQIVLACRSEHQG
ncbi:MULTISPECIES: hypothetical protein [Sphingomonas]|jgi:hypothetical protein|uniref:Uncharacterized protein n=2 Tax=Sphingomonas TaxID=13687 RepID=A0A147J6L5_9SPHN|nr:hypothetical protein [Sphingomonas sanguinis]KTW10423.1 hypothetical protein NS258_12715 [Sphingomonas sanguinis]